MVSGGLDNKINSDYQKFCLNPTPSPHTSDSLGSVLMSTVQQNPLSVSVSPIKPLTTSFIHTSLTWPRRKAQIEEQVLLGREDNRKRRDNSSEEMKLIWSPETATKAYIDTVKACELSRESGVAELVSAMAAGWNGSLIVETWSQGGIMATSIGLAIAARHSGGRHVCVVPDERSRIEYVKAMGEAGKSPEVVVGEAEEVMEGLVGIDFLVVDSRRRDFASVLRLAKLSTRGAVLVCKNASSRSASNFRWRTVFEDGSRLIVRSVFLPVGNGLDMAHVAATSGGNSGPSKAERRWIKHVDRQSGEEHVIRT